MLQRRVVKRSKAPASNSQASEDSTFHEAEAAPQDWNCTSGVVIQPPHALEAHDLELPSDSLAALLLLRAQFPRTEAWQLPVGLRSQVYSLVRDRTAADRDLEHLRNQNKIRMFRLPLSSDPYCYCLTEDYVEALRRAAKDHEGRGTPQALARVFDWFAERVLPQCLDLAISKPHLLELLSTPHQHGASKKRKLPEGGIPAATEDHVSLLLNSGFLARDASDRDGFVLGPGNVGPLVSSIMKGRKELLGFVARRQHSQILVKQLEKKKLVRTALGLRFHLRDLLGSGSIIQVQTTSGALVRIAKKN